MSENQLMQFIMGLFNEVAGGRADWMVVALLLRIERPVLYLLRKVRAGIKVFDRWIRVNYHDLKLACLWAAGLIVVGSYYGDTDSAPMAVQLAIVLPFLGFVAMVVADRWRKFKLNKGRTL